MLKSMGKKTFTSLRWKFLFILTCDTHIYLLPAGYWESLVQQLKAHMAKTRLRERHQEVLRQKLFKLKQEVCYIDNDIMSYRREQ